MWQWLFYEEYNRERVLMAMWKKAEEKPGRKTMRLCLRTRRQGKQSFPYCRAHKNLV
jgi:hypothetical protein